MITGSADVHDRSGTGWTLPSHDVGSERLMQFTDVTFEDTSTAFVFSSPVSVPPALGPISFIPTYSLNSSFLDRHGLSICLCKIKFYEHHESHGLLKTFDEMANKDKIFPVLNQLGTMPWKRMREWRYSSTILDLSIRWNWVVNSVPVERAPLYISDRRLCGSQSRSELVEKRKILTLSRIEPGPPNL
jgi:hypothetical protein